MRRANIYSSSPPHLLEKANGIGIPHWEPDYHYEEKALPTHDSLLAKEDIDNSDVFVPGVVKFTLSREHHQYPNSPQPNSDLTFDFEMSKLSVCFRLIGLGNDDM